MKKLAFDSSNWKLIGTINELIDLVNSQQEAIGELQTEIGVLRNMVLPLEPADDKPRHTVSGDYKLTIPTIYGDVEVVGDETAVLELKELIDRRRGDTHRTVTLRIPKGMTVGKAVWSTLDQRDENCLYRLFEQSDTDLQKALDEVKGESNE